MAIGAHAHAQIDWERLQFNLDHLSPSHLDQQLGWGLGDPGSGLAHLGFGLSAGLHLGGWGAGGWVGLLGTAGNFGGVAAVGARESSWRLKLSVNEA